MRALRSAGSVSLTLTALQSPRQATALDRRRAACCEAFMTEKTLDLRGLRCPLPALKARKVLGKLVPGDALVLECTDPLTAIDIPNLVRETGDVLESNSESPGLLVFRIRKAGGRKA